MLALVTDTPKADAAAAGALFGLLFGAAMTPFARGDTLKRAILDESEFLSELRFALAQMHYEQSSAVGDLYQFDPTGLAGASVAGLNLSPRALNRVVVRVKASEATILGPRWVLRKLDKQLASPPMAHL